MTTIPWRHKAILALVLRGTLHAQADPGATVVTHHETIPNPVFGSTFRVAASCKLATTCDWASSTTWTSGSVPGPSSLVIVDGKVRIYNQQAQALEVGVYPGGVLSFQPSAATLLTTGSVVVFAGGRFEAGTQAEPISASVSAGVVIRDLPFSNDPKQHLRGIVVVDGTLRVHGRALTETYLRAATAPARTQSTVLLESSATAAGWRVGDSVVLPTSAQCPVASGGTCPDQTEDRNITAVSTDGRTLTLSAPLQFDHPGARNNAGVVEFLPHVVNKSRNVFFRSENPAGIRGHILLHGRTDADVRYAAIQNFGRTNIADLGVTNQKGRYPLHAHHLIGPRPVPSSGYQFAFVGNVVDFGVENRQRNHKWGITVHGSHYGLIDRNVCDYASGAGIVTEDASETGNLFRRNFVMRVVGGNGARTEDTDPGDGSKLGRAGVAFWFNGGGNNIYEENVAAAVAECIYCYGFKFDNVYNSTVVIPNQRGDDPHHGEGASVDPYTIGLRRFTRNEAYAVPNGLTIWWMCTLFESPRDGCSSLVKDFRVWHHHRWGYFAYETNNMVVDGFVHRGNTSIISNIHESVTGLYLIDYMQRKTVIRNADIQGASYGIIAPVHRDVRGSSGPENGITVVEDSNLIAGTNIDIVGPYSTNGISNLSVQTTVLRNVRFGHPSTRQYEHISVGPGNNSNNLIVRNDIRIMDYNTAAGGNAADLYLTPLYQAASVCDNAIGDCSTDLAASYAGQLDGTRVYALRSAPAGVPYSPLGLVATVSGIPGVTLVWSDISVNELGFKIERKTGSGSFTEITTTGPDIRTFFDSNVSSGSSYVYRVRAFNGAGNSGYSSEAPASIPGVSTVPSCDANLDAVVDIVDVQLVVNKALGLAACGNQDLDGDGQCGVVDLQRVVNAVLGAVCRIGP